jgi:hypothetical protein
MHERIPPIPTTVAAARAPLAYVRPGVMPRRPALLTALAVVTLIYASLSFVVNVASFAFHAGVWWLEPSPPKVETGSPIPSAQVDPYDGDPADVDGLKRAERDAVVAITRARLKLPADRAEMLRRLLADVGRRVFPRDVDLTRSPPSIIVESGRVAGPDGDGPRASHWFVTPRGRVELSDYTATFALDGATQRVRLVRNVLYDGDARPHWSAVARGEAVEAQRANFRGNVTAEQASVLLREWRARDAGESTDWYDRPVVVRSELRDPAWTFALAADEPETWLLPDGRTIARSAAPQGVDVARGVAILKTPVPISTYWPGDRGAFAVLAAGGFLGAVLAAYLFVGAVMLLREAPMAGNRFVWFLVIKTPLLLMCGFALSWWLTTHQRSIALSNLPQKLAELFPLSLIAMLVYPAALVVVLRVRRVRWFFQWRAEDPWHPVRGARDALRSSAWSRPLGYGMAVLAVAHVALALWCARTTSLHGSVVQTNAHALAALVDALFAGALLLPGPRRTAVRATVVLAMLVLAPRALAQPSSGPVSPWAVEDLLSRAQGEDPAAAREAVRRLARAGDAGQDALLRLLDGPVPPIGLDGVLTSIGAEWFDKEVGWSRQHRPRALRLVLEWVQIIEQAEDVRAIAVIEAMGPQPELEPLLRPLLTAWSPAVRSRAAQFLLGVNPRPVAMVRALERDLGLVGKPSLVAEAMVNLRPTSDPILARLMTDLSNAARPHVVAALVNANAPLSPELLEAARQLARFESPDVHRSALLLMRNDVDGRRAMIDLSLGNAHATVAARELLNEHWPQTAAVFDRLGSRQGDRRAIESAARRVLTRLNEGGDLAALTDEVDEELRAQALIVLVDGQFAERLGPVTLRLTETVEAPQQSALEWRRAVPPAGVARPFVPPPWLSMLLFTFTGASLLSVLVVALRPRPS